MFSLRLLVFTVLGLVCASCLATKSILMQTDPLYDDKELFPNSTLGPPLGNVRLTDCVQYCLSETECSMFSFNENEDTCQLYSNTSFPISFLDFGMAQSKAGVKNYFQISERPCPEEFDYVYFSVVDACIKFYNESFNYVTSVSECQSMGGRLAILENEVKANAVMDMLDTLGLGTTYMYIGLTRVPSTSVFVWNDGSTMGRTWWKNGEPNGAHVPENCVAIRFRLLYDVPCVWIDEHKGSICEIP